MLIHRPDRRSTRAGGRGRGDLNGLARFQGSMPHCETELAGTWLGRTSTSSVERLRRAQSSDFGERSRATSTSSVERLRRAQSSDFGELPSGLSLRVEDSRASLALPVHSTAIPARQEPRPPCAFDCCPGSAGGSPSRHQAGWGSRSCRSTALAAPSWARSRKRTGQSP